MKYLITGKNGQLGRAFVKRFEAEGVEYYSAGSAELDITDRDAVEDAIASVRPGVIINCAAYNLVDQAEQEPDAAERVNASGPGILAAAARKRGITFVHYSSDYVFDGAKESGLYTEADFTRPLNAYGRSKLSGEQLVRHETDEYLIFRLSWVFGDGEQNFIAKLLSWVRGSEYIKIACDEFSVPTYTESIVDVTLNALRQGVRGLYHLTGSGFCSRYEWTKIILSAAGIEKFVRPVSMDSFRLAARRPKFSAMSNEAIARILGITIPHWEDSTRRFMASGAGIFNPAARR